MKNNGKKYFLNRCMKQIRQMIKLFSTKLCEKEGVKQENMMEWKIDKNSPKGA